MGCSRRRHVGSIRGIVGLQSDRVEGQGGRLLLDRAFAVQLSRAVDAYVAKGGEHLLVYRGVSRPGNLGVEILGQRPVPDAGRLVDTLATDDFLPQSLHGNEHGSAPPALVYPSRSHEIGAVGEDRPEIVLVVEQVSIGEMIEMVVAGTAGKEARLIPPRLRVPRILGIANDEAGPGNLRPPRPGIRVKAAEDIGEAFVHGRAPPLVAETWLVIAVLDGKGGDGVLVFVSHDLA